MTISIDQLRMAALMLNTSREMPRLLEILKSFGASKVSAVQEHDRPACLLAIVEAKMARKHALWVLHS